ncbi:hypothetical protein IFR04_002915 [Cadophora malorum]|uniref:Uncharacterized protein n=1 Tax=Cadophora malorum TaxID=108018 RepID=A0A8H8BTV4_9HELO|nr:hypothetical protein IFR04_002915 [Cadophora malorum]
MVDFVAYQDVECVYPMSGQYGRAPRALYYFLLVFVSIVRKENWLTAGAAATCLTFGGAAAIHAIILASYLSLGKSSIQDGPMLLPNSSTVPVAALATDLDSDATLAIVGTGFLIVVPLALWSANFKHAAAAPILVLWTLLMSIGMIASMINLYSVDGSSSGPLKQFRFCKLGYNDTLPFGGSSATVIDGSWNDTVWSHFEKLNQDSASAPSCIYPCLTTSQRLRHPDSLAVIQFFDLQPSDPLYWGMNVVAAIIYGCVPLSIFICVIILVLQLRGHDLEWDFESGPETSWKTRLKNISIGAINGYGKIMSPFVFIVFLVWVEWIISYDLQAESMKEIGQWAPLVGFALALIAAVVGKYWPELSKAWKTHRKRKIVGVLDGEEVQNLVQMTRDIPPTAWGVVGLTYIQAHSAQ